MSPNTDYNNHNEDNEVRQSFNIKTLKVNWEGNKNSFMHVFIDTTDIVKLEEANNNIRCQKIMFASASHEFRTPLNAILNSLKLAGGQLKEAQQEVLTFAGFKNKASEASVLDKFKMMQKFIDMGSKSSVLMLALVEDILDLSKLEGGTFEIHKSVFRIDMLISEIEEIFQQQCKQKRIDLQIEIDEELNGLAIVSDKSRIKQILLNLLSNSYKFTFRGKIALRAKVKEENDKEYIEF
jgi:signal transduction histidine kinase